FAWRAAARRQDNQIEIGEGVINGAAEQVELPAGADIGGGFEVGSVLQRTASRDLIAGRAAGVKLFVIGEAFTAQIDIAGSGQRHVLDASGHFGDDAD